MKILYITDGTPWPPNIGVNQRTNLLYGALSECGKVDLIINSKYVKFTAICLIQGQGRTVTTARLPGAGNRKCRAGDKLDDLPAGQVHKKTKKLKQTNKNLPKKKSRSPR